jgi:hypothetical protein
VVAFLAFCSGAAAMIAVAMFLLAKNRPVIEPGAEQQRWE